MTPGAELSVASKWYRCLVFSFVDAFTDITDILLGGSMTDHELQMIDSILEEGILVHKNLVLCVMYNIYQYILADVIAMVAESQLPWQ